MPDPSMEPQLAADPAAMRDEWLARLDDLIAKVKGWAEGAGWRTRKITKPMDDSVLGEYRAPALLMQRETVQVILDTVSRFVLDADGAVDLYLMPAYDDIASLYLAGGEWTLYSTFPDAPAISGVREPEVLALSEGSVLRVLDVIAARAG